MDSERIDEYELRQIYASDQELYPAQLSLATLRSWVEASPTTSLSFRLRGAGDDAATARGLDRRAGVVVVLPLVERHWRRLLAGAVKETEIDPRNMFPGAGAAALTTAAREQEREVVGLHVFHVERFEAFPAHKLGSFTRYAMAAVEAAARAMPWEVVGYSGAFCSITSRLSSRDGFPPFPLRTRVATGSVPDSRNGAALTASPAGRATFAKMGYEPTGYEEVFIQSTSAGPGESAEMTLVCRYPGQAPEASLDDSTTVASRAEMRAKQFSQPTLSNERTY